MQNRIVNFYKFIALESLPDLRASLRAEAARRDLLGTILLAPEGINAGLSGPDHALADFIVWLRQDPRFADVELKESGGVSRPFRRLLVKIKPWVIRFAEADDPDVQAIRAGGRLTPMELRELLRRRPEEVVLVDTRNDYETDYGAFAGAVRLPIQRFTEFPAAFERVFGDQKDKTFVFYCTGGIRCEKVVPWAQAHGFIGATQLDGGILKYFEECGDEGFAGDCFVFDGRWVVDSKLAETEDCQPDQRLQPKPRRD